MISAESGSLFSTKNVSNDPKGLEHIQSNVNGSNSFEIIKHVRDKGSSSYCVLIIAPGQKAKYGYLFEFHSVFSLESPHRVHKIHHFQYKKENHPKLSQTNSYGIFSKGLQNEFETAAINEPSVSELLKDN